MTIATGQNAEAQDIISSNYMYGADAGANDTYVVTLPEAPASYTDGLTIRFKANTANTGASTLNVNSLGAIAIKRPNTLDTQTGDIVANQVVEVVYRGGSFYMTSPVGGDVPYCEQSIPLPSLATDAGDACGSNADGSVLYIIHNQTDISRWERDANTGIYFVTHAGVALSPLSIPSNDYGAIVVLGNYVYVFSNDSTNIICRRFDAADLANNTAMTVPTVACTSVVMAWTDGTDIYVISSSSDTTSRRWTLSGTTLTAASTYTLSGNALSQVAMCSFFDGTSVYICRSDKGNHLFYIYKLTTVDGITYSTTIKNLYYFAVEGEEEACFAAVIDARRMYIGVLHAISDQTNAETKSRMALLPVTKP